jgi:hypothetical protein
MFPVKPTPHWTPPPVGVISRDATDRAGRWNMAKGQMRSNKEAKKPKKEKPKTIAAAPPTVKIGKDADKKK